MSELLAISAADYHADAVADVPTLSASIAKILLQKSPEHARAAHPKLNTLGFVKSEPTAQMDFGTAVHSLFLEDDESKIQVVLADSWRSKAAQEERAIARAAGRIAILDKDMVRVEAVVKALKLKVQMVKCSPALFVDGAGEQTIVWNENGVACRTRIDWLHTNAVAIDDLKTTSLSANPHSWSRQLFAMGYDVQAAFYLRAVGSLYPLDGSNIAPHHEAVYRLAIIETEPPYALSVMGLGQAGLTLANAKVDRALELWKRCLDSGEWPGYSTQVAYADPPAWAEEQFWASVDEGADG